ncbi:WW domain binding protein 11-domain-containing protein [Polychytrium aggregatum]|uniref:WW domain binding protein 11-domain-containing protein n=1 Tax=Polychytrium aggregatum TaxID=110093 RepID=UPI0022FDC6A5|nr:WW domain binding protein 11-domain-containing protein [Polychytrium aggregatum]KAI9203250.1 WW domain binding protein 11-domain-containing protein [Polychytrium aggregatum]
MAKGSKSLNPTDLYRKLQKKKELKKNKEDRKRGRLVSAAQKDSSKLQEELGSLLQQDRDGTLDKSLTARKKELEEEFEAIQTAREKLGLARQTVKVPEAPAKPPPRDPTKSIYYHPTLNPFGTPPPGKPYIERTDGGVVQVTTLQEPESEPEQQTESAPEPVVEETKPQPPPITFEDLDIPLPPGPAPDVEAHVFNTLDLPEIRNKADYMPSASKPAQAAAGPSQIRPMAPGPIRPLPAPSFPRPMQPMYHPGMPQWNPPYMGMPGMVAAPYMGGPPGMLPYPPAFNAYPPRPYPLPLNVPGSSRRPPSQGPIRPMKEVTISAQTLAQRPPQLPPTPRPAPAPGTVISAAPQVRDFQKELTSLVPPSLLRKSKTSAALKPSASLPAMGKPQVNAAPDLDEERGPEVKRPQSLVDALSGSLQSIRKVRESSKPDDYDAFMKDMEGLL